MDWQEEQHYLFMRVTVEIFNRLYETLDKEQLNLFSDDETVRCRGRDGFYSCVNNIDEVYKNTMNVYPEFDEDERVLGAIKILKQSCYNEFIMWDGEEQRKISSKIMERVVLEFYKACNSLL